MVCRYRDETKVNQHIPVLRDDLVDAVVTDPDGIYLDATFGRGGYARALLKKLSPKASLMALDRDPDAYQAAVTLSREDSRVQAEHGIFGELDSILSGNQCEQLSGLMTVSYTHLTLPTTPYV